MKIDQHYVPRLVLRKYDERISTYNIHTGEIKVSGSKLKDTFSSDLLYSQEIEDLFNEKIESDFARILNEKILLDESKIVLKRTELATVKKFLLLAMIRTLDGESFVVQRKQMGANGLKKFLKFEEKNVDNLSDFDYWMRTIRCILESADLGSVKNHPEATTQAVRWATTFNSGYISIWDSSDTKEEFVVIDNGMTSEHEPTRFMPEIGNDVIKRGYLLDKTIFSSDRNEENKKIDFRNYYNLIFSLDYFTENMYLFSISKNRMIALINPFFRLYDKDESEGTHILPTPDIWTTRIKDKSLFLKNKNEYINNLLDTLNGKTDKNDSYIYPVRQMMLDDVIYINCLSFDRISNIVGFTDSSKIRKSLAVYSISRGLNDYSKLIQYFEELGNPIIINDYAKKISSHIAPRMLKFSEQEQKYINHFLQLRKMNGGKLF